MLNVNSTWKVFRSEDYNYNFNLRTGLMARWGRNKKDDPIMSPYGPELADIEISTICNGPDGRVCSFCYKSNTPKGKNMTLSTFKKVFKSLTNDKPSSLLSQIAFGVGTLSANKDLWDIMNHCRENNVIPNITINGYKITDDDVNKLSYYCGAVAVSNYEPKDICYNTVRRLLDAGIKQTNIHMMASSQSYDRCFELIDDYTTDKRLKGMGALVFLGCKEKGKRNADTSLKSNAKYKRLIDYAIKKGAKIGFDSCSAPSFLEAVKDTADFGYYSQLAESCESSRFSIFCNVDGEIFPCSFCEGNPGWETGIDLLNDGRDFIDIWLNDDKLVEWRKKLTATNKKCSHLGSDVFMCPEFDLYE